MKPAVTISLIILVLGAVALAVYLNSDSFFGGELNDINLSISAEEGRKKVKTGYIITTSEEVILGNTSQVYELITTSSRDTIEISNSNLKGQFYFKDKKVINSSLGSARIDLELSSPQKIEYDILSDNPLVISLESKDARNITYCLDWTINYIFVSSVNATEVDSPKGYPAWDKCYSLDVDLKNSNKTIEIDYREFSNPSADDKIEVLFIQEEFIGEKDQIIKVK